jgi:hypothetical protein
MEEESGNDEEISSPNDVDVDVDVDDNNIQRDDVTKEVKSRVMRKGRERVCLPNLSNLDENINWRICTSLVVTCCMGFFVPPPSFCALVNLVLISIRFLLFHSPLS